MPHAHRRLMSTVLALLLLPWPAAATAQETLATEPTLETIMAHPDWIGNPPDEPYFGDDGRSVYYLRKRNGTEQMDLIRVDLESGNSAFVALGDRGKADAPGGDLSLDRRWKTYARNGDVFLKDLQTGTLRQITRTEEMERDPRFLVGDSRITFQRGDAAFVFDLVSGTLAQPAVLQLKKDPAADEDSGYLDEQQERLFEIIRKRKEDETVEREEDRASRQVDPTRAPLPWYLGEDVEIIEASLSPAGDWMLVFTQAKGREEKPALMARFVTEDGYLKSDEVRSKVGTEPLADHKVLLLDLTSHKQHDVDLSKLPGITEDPLKELREKAEKKKEKATATDKDKDKKDGKADKKDEKKKDEEKKPRPVEAQGLFWSDDGRSAALLLRAADNKDRWIATLEREKPEPVTRHRLTDPAWINWDFNELGWLPDNETLWYTSEETGYSNLYTVSTKGGTQKPRRLIEGDFEVSNVVAARDGKHLYYRANPSHPGVHDVWRVPVAAGEPEQLSKLGGETFFWLSLDEAQLLLLHSTTTRHGELYVQPAQVLPAGTEARQITHTPQPRVPRHRMDRARDRADPLVAREAAHLLTGLHAAGLRPAPENIRRWSSSTARATCRTPTPGGPSYFREFMFHTLLTRRGYVVLDMDYRASAGYGRDWRTAIYRQMGYPEVEDLEDGVAWLARNQSVDPAAGRHLRRLLRRLPHLHGPVPQAGPLRRRRRPAPGHRLGPLQPRVHLEHPQHAGGRPRGLREELAHRVRRRASPSRS